MTYEEIRAPESFDGSEGLLAIVVRQRHPIDEGVTFLTDATQPQQVGLMHHPKGHRVEPHVHKWWKRRIYSTQEVLLVRSGRVKVDVFTASHLLVETTELTAGDVICFLQGGHGMEMLEESELVEIKNGPYRGPHQDKVRF